MSEVNLLAFGCVVSFIGAAGAYVYIREAYMASDEPPREQEVQSAEAVSHEVRDVS